MEKQNTEQYSSIPTEMQMLIAGIIPNSKHMDIRFDMLQVQSDSLKKGQNDMNDRIDHFEKDMDYRFTLVDKRFEQVDKRFEQVDRRFEQIDKRFEQMTLSIDKLGDKFDASMKNFGNRIDSKDEKQRGFTIRMFSIAISISLIGALGIFFKSFGIFQ